jgi:hypothetical protein
MESSRLDVNSSWLPPWHPSPPQFFSAVDGPLPFDQLAVGIPALEHPQTDELIQSRGFPAEQLTAWFNGASESDPLFRAALHSGMAITEPAPSHDHNL